MANDTSAITICIKLFSLNLITYLSIVSNHDTQSSLNRHRKISFMSLIPGLLRSSFEPSVGAAGWRGSRRTARRTRSARRRSNVAAGRTTSCADGNLEDDSRLARPENSQRLCHGTLQKTKAIKHLLLMMMITQLRQQGKCDDSLNNDPASSLSDWV